jgi:hypothetical protein
MYIESDDNPARRLHVAQMYGRTGEDVQRLQLHISQ